MSSIARLFLEIKTAGITGESEDEGFKGQIELDSWEWALERKQKTTDKTTHSTPGDNKPVSPEPSPFRFSKAMDKSTAQLLNRLKSGEAFSATFTLIEDSDLRFELAVYLDGARVIKYNMNGKDEAKGGRIDESWVLNYDDIYFEQTSQLEQTSQPSAKMPKKETPKKVTSNHLHRTASASTESPDAVKKVMASFASLQAPEKIEVVTQIRKRFPDEMKGQLPAESKSTSSSAKISEVVKAFWALGKSDRDQALKDMK